MNLDMGTDDVSGATVTRIMFCRQVWWLSLGISVGIGGVGSLSGSGEMFRVK